MAAAKVKNIAHRRLAEESHRRLTAAARRAYAAQQKETIDNQQIAEMLPLVHRVVQRVVTYIRPPLSYEDLVSAGTVGLVRAARDYDSSHQAGFKTYAYIRIRGAILDELRRWSFVPANVDKQIRQTIQASMEITEQTGLTPTDVQLAEKLHISMDKLYNIFESTRAKHFVSIDDSPEDAPAIRESIAATGIGTPHEQVEKAELVGKLAEAITQLDQRQRQIVVLYYQQQLTMKQIAEVFGITEPRVSQLHASALFNLSSKLRQWKDGR